MGRLVDLNDAKALIEDIYKRDKDTINMSYKIVKAGLKPCYISKEQVKELWDKKPICIEFADGTDALAQENGYTLEQCLAMSDVRFFLDTLKKNKQK